MSIWHWSADDNPLVDWRLLHDLVSCNRKYRCWFADAGTGLQVSAAAGICGLVTRAAYLTGCCVVLWYLQRYNKETRSDLSKTF